MEDTYKYYLGRFTEKKTTFSKPFMMFLDKNGVMDGIEEINVYIYPYRLVHIEENVLFRTNYEHIKHKSEDRYILLLKHEELQEKLQDFIKRADGGRVNNIDIKDVLDTVEEDLSWHERINHYNVSDIRNIFNELIHYRKQFKKNMINMEEIDRIILSALYDMDAISINGDADCYIFYKNIIELHGGINQENYVTNIKELLCKVFYDNGGEFMHSVVHQEIFNEFEKLMWTCYVLDFFKKLNGDNIKKVIGLEFIKVEVFEKYYNDLVTLAKIIEKKDKKLFISMKDRAEKWVLDSGIDLYSVEQNHLEFIKENIASYICVLDGIKNILKDFNIEGFKKVFKYNLENLLEVKETLKNIPYATENTNKVKSFFNDFFELVSTIEEIEKDSAKILSLNLYTDWVKLYRDKLLNLQYLLSKVRFSDEWNIIEKSRYAALDRRISNILNKYRKSFAEFYIKNYNSWLTTEYGPSRPILNNDIEKLIDLKDEKIFIIIFDGMRYDAWDNVVYKYFEDILLSRETRIKSSFSLLPSITSISREAIYKNIIDNNKADVTYMTKSESYLKQDDIKENLLLDKKINIFIYNMFDKDGHKATEDLYLFYAKQDTVFENSIKNLVKKIPDDASIIIAADHGMMRLDKYINVKDIDGLTTVKSRFLELKYPKEFEDGITLDNYIFSYTNRGYFTGGGEKDFYSHGGCSMEEVIVPFIYARPLSNNHFTSYTVTKTIDEKGETIILHDGKRLKLPFKVSDKEQVFLANLYKFSTLNTTDIEKLFKNQFGSAGLIDGMLRRFIRKLQRAGITIIDTTAAGEFVVYKINTENLFGGGWLE
ncbi:PglZ domain-containing protein [Xylanivirga thermophila]|uniref:PglZ domain-containing protein n=1 Tax=Xylanivirga thermophila TaxID=2496273 RepID=UPI00101E059E|nr:PglZ domain-containing protein [Xylanivirga thermophila]